MNIASKQIKLMYYINYISQSRNFSCTLYKNYIYISSNFK